MQESYLIAQIKETDCIGCGKCISACPVDAIIGSMQQMHSILTQECIGCGLCVSPCPIDCIVMHPLPERLYQPALAKKRHQARKQRLAAEQQVKFTQTMKLDDSLAAKKAAIQAAFTRAQAKRIGN